jgi:tRNA threonylcarbamoyladenosine biosynthesis protein TsaB
MLAADRMPLRHGHAEALLPLVERVMAAAGLLAKSLEFIAVTTGPGGFTGIRVGLAAAHGIALAVNARLIGLDSFAAVAAAAAPAGTGRPLLIALDSRRAELYVQLFAPDEAGPLAPPQAILPASLADYAARTVGGRALLLAGDAAEPAAAALAGRMDYSVVADSAPDARGVAAAALRLICAGAPLGPALPLYLRAPDVTLPRPRPVPAA